MRTRLANRLSVVAPSMTVKVTALAAEMRARGVDVVSLSAGEPDFDTPAHIKEAAKRALDAGATKYTAVEGTPRLRQAVAAWLAKAHGFPVAPAEVMVSAGAKQAIHNAFHALLDPGDEVLLPAPCWVSYAEIAKLAGARPVPVLSRPEDGFAIDPARIAKAVTRATRMIVLSSPSNPTGAVFGEAALRAVADLAEHHDLWLLTDDVYRGLCYGGARFVQPATFGPEIRRRTIIVDGVSKSYAMTGWRIGFCLAPPEVIAGMATLQGQSTTNAAAVSQAAALAALEGPQEDLERMRAAFDERRRLMLAGLRAIPGVTCVEPKGAFYAFPDVASFFGKQTPAGRTIRDDVALCEHLLEAAQVAVVPGSAFFAPGFVRLSYATSAANIEKGLSRMAKALAELR
ncbi:MAG: pyridoxal phosphate-dependent aminotransferase [Deltaproteobacteria bacterium]|jgi:aspartate aminotransferase|nr:pyridoxal phosphate-dependent aminotransferase [Deltaproteobacteria bacterium]